MNTQIYDVLPGQPFGRGTSTATISADPCARASCSGTSGTTSLAVTDVQGTFADGDLVLIHQTRDASDQANWEVNKIVSGSGGATFTLANNLGRTYTTTSGGADKLRAQVVQIKEYLNLTINSFTGTGWRATENYAGNGWGGIIAVAVANTLTTTGTANLNGMAGWTTTQDHNTSTTADYYVHASTVGGGFRGGWNSTDAGTSSAGEGINGSFTIESTTAQANGGGGTANSGAGGGGNATAGGAGGDGGAGSAVGSADLTQMYFGGGGGGCHDQGASATSGGGGGGIFAIWAKRIVTTSGGFVSNGGAGGSGTGGGPRPGGGGAGGCILINCEIGTFTAGWTANAGSKGGTNAGDGSAGRIRINYGSSITGDNLTSPAASTNQDPKLVVPTGGMAFFNAFT